MRIKVDLQIGADPDDHMVGTFKVPHWFVAATLLAMFATVALYGFAAYQQWVWQNPSTATGGTMLVPDSVKPPEKPDIEFTLPPGTNFYFPNDVTPNLMVIPN